MHSRPARAPPPDYSPRMPAIFAMRTHFAISDETWLPSSSGVAGALIDYNLLAEPIPECGGNNPSDDVVTAHRQQRDNGPDRERRIILRMPEVPRAKTAPNTKATEHDVSG
jgi:hypothetical protein